MIYTRPYTVRSNEIDHDYQVRPYILLTYVQDAVIADFADRGYAAYDLRKNGYSWVVSYAHIEFNYPLPTWNSTVTVKIWTRETRGIRMFRDFEVFDEAETKIAMGSTCWHIIDQRTQRPQVIEELITPPPVVTHRATPELPHHDLSPFHECLGQMTHVFRLSDLDYNKHLTHTRFASGTIEMIPTSFTADHRLKSMTLKFLKAAQLHDIVTGVTYREDNCFFHSISKGENEICKALTIWE